MAEEKVINVEEMNEKAAKKTKSEQESHATLHYKNLSAPAPSDFISKKDPCPVEPNLKTFEKEAEKESGLSTGKKLLSKVPFLFKNVKEEVKDLKEQAAPIARERYEEAHAEWQKKVDERSERVAKLDEALHTLGAETNEYFKYAVEKDSFKLYEDAGKYERGISDMTIGEEGMSLRVRIPLSEEMRLFSQYVYDQNTNTIIGRRLGMMQMIKYQTDTARAILLRTAALALKADEYKVLGAVTVTGYQVTPANEKKDVIRITVSHEAMDAIDLRNADVAAVCEKELGEVKAEGLYMKAPTVITAL